MPTLALRAILAAAALLPSISDIVFAEPTSLPTVAEDNRLLPYVSPDQLVDINGRRINLHCTGIGIGSPSVILMAGSLSWSFTWYKTQPEIAKRARVCAFDRAGYGFSDSASQPQILPDTMNDLHAALNAADVPGPYVAVAAGGCRYTSKQLKCVLLAAHGPLEPSSPEYEHCSIGPLPTDTPDALQKIWPSFFTADHAAAQLSLISS